jgi:protein-tyrosine kinase
MNIIERAGELLRSDAAIYKEPSSGAQTSLRHGDVIDRAISEFAEHSGFIEPQESPLQPVAEASTPGREKNASPEPTGTETSGTVKVNIERLRRQGIITPGGQRTQTAESFRRIKRHILANVANSKAGGPQNANLVLVTSSLPGEGKSFCAVNLAISIALEIDHTVLLVDADVAKPRILDVLGVQAERGLMDVLLDRRIEIGDVLLKTDIGKLSLLPAGTAHNHATEFLASDSMRVILREMAERYEDRIIIFDSPPILAASESAVLASRMGQIVMVVEAGRTSEAILKTALARIEPSNFVGLLLNKGEGPRRGYGYGEYG